MSIIKDHTYIIESKSVKGFPPFWHTREGTLPTFPTLEGAHAAVRSAFDIPEDQPIAFTLHSRLYNTFVEVDEDYWPQIGYGREIFVLLKPQDQSQSGSPPLSSSQSQPITTSMQSQRSGLQIPTLPAGTWPATLVRPAVPSGRPMQLTSIPDDWPQAISSGSIPRTNRPVYVFSTPNIPESVNADNGRERQNVNEAPLDVLVPKRNYNWPPTRPLPATTEETQGYVPDTSHEQSTGPMGLNSEVETLPKMKKGAFRHYRLSIGPYPSTDGTENALDAKRGRGRPRVRPIGPKRKRGRPSKEEKLTAFSAWAEI